MLHFEVRGDEAARAVVFLHGFMGVGSDWEEVAAGLEDRYRCIMVDLPGQGASAGLAEADYTMAGAASAVDEVLEAVGVAQATIVGYSMGGRLALYYAVHHPDRCRRLVLESASPGLEGEADRAARRGVDEARAVRLETDDFGAFLGDWYRQPLFASLGDHPGLRERMTAARSRNDPRELARVLRGMGTGRQPSLWKDLSALAPPTLLVAGARDGKYVELAERMGVLIPKARTAIIPNAGHTVHAECPAAFTDLLLDFLERPTY